MVVKPCSAVAPHSTARLRICWNVIALPPIPEEIEQAALQPSLPDGDMTPRRSSASQLPGIEQKDMPEPQFPDSAFSFPRPLSPASERVSSPTPSVMSISSVSSTSLPATPYASDDEFYLEPAPKKIRRRVVAIPKLGEHSPESDGEDSEWYAKELGKMLTLYAPSSPESTSRGSLLENIPPSPVYYAKTSASPSTELDPSFPRRRSTSRRRHRFSTNAPPVPPIPAHFRSLSASSTSSVSSSSASSVFSSSVSSVSSSSSFSLTPSSARPPPRSPLPSDADAEDEEDLLLSYYTSPRTPPSVRQPISPILEMVEENGETNVLVLDVDLEPSLQVPSSLPAAYPDELGNDVEISAVPNSNSNDTPSPELRSRWSTSTIDSIYDQRPTSPVTKLWFQLAGTTTKSKQASPSKKNSLPPRPTSPPSPTLEDRTVRVHESSRRSLRIPAPPRPQFPRVLSTAIRRRASTFSSSSYATSYTTSASSSAQNRLSRSSSSDGLRRKPIPVEMFMRV